VFTGNKLELLLPDGDPDKSLRDAAEMMRCSDFNT